VLPAPNRLRDGSDFASAIRGSGGARAGSRLVVVHAIATGPRVGLPPRVGFVVSKAVGGAVVRNRTKRRLRAAVAARLGTVPAGVDVVVRAQPAAGTATFGELCEDLKPLLDKVIHRIGVRT
jgi:ribonuclease P protein component